MKASEIRGGQVSTIQLSPVTGAFEPRPARESEVSLVISGDELLLQSRDLAWPVEPESRAGRAAVIEVVEGGMPRICWLAHIGAAQASVQVHRFPSELHITDQMQIGIDERIADDIRRTFGIGGPVVDVCAWLDEQVFLGSDEKRRAVVAPSRTGELDSFLVLGARIAVSVHREKDHLKVVKVSRGGLHADLALTLVHAPLSFRDATASAAIASGARHALQEAVRSKDSYMRIWVEYNKLEQEAILRRARTVGAIPYTRATRRTDGGWAFELGDFPDLEKRLRGLGESERFEFEASRKAPDFESLETPSEEDPLTAPILDFDLPKRRLDLAAPREDEGEQPPPPEKGFLFLSLRGDRTRLKRRTDAEKQLRTGACPMPWIGLLIEGRPTKHPNWHRRDGMSKSVLNAFGGRPTVRQTEAINVALNTPDIALIQGPPGTGKTKVITALQRRIAELADEGVEVSHRILVTSAQHEAVVNLVDRSEVFGLPAVRVGSSRRDDGASVDGVAKFRADRIEALKSGLRTPPDDELLKRSRRAAVAILRAPLPPADTARHLREILDAVGTLISPEFSDRVRARIQALERPQTLGAGPENASLRLEAARGISTLPAAFLDGGARRAHKAIARLADIMTDDELAILQACADWTREDEAPSSLQDVERVRAALIDRLTVPASPVRPAIDDITHRLLCEVIDSIDRRRKESVVGDDAVLAEWLDDLESDEDAVRTALEHYTAVLAATLQQSASKPMQTVLGIDVGSVTFETVIVDEAARSHPLDLFIPLTMARRRVVLVGDHRQLPHMLEPNVERELGELVRQGGELQAEAIEAVRSSLFHRLWVLLRKLEDEDGIPRTVTLDTQFRMHPELGSFVSRMFYERWGDVAIESGERAEAFAHRFSGYAIGDRPRVAAWLDVPGGKAAGEQRAGTSFVRPIEARAIAREVRRLIDEDPSMTFGVIAFYRAQVDKILEEMGTVGLAERTDGGHWRVAEQWRRTTNADGVVERLRVGTVDAFQGKEFDVVFLSVTRSNTLPKGTDIERRKKYGHLTLDNRLCVAMSRQHRLLITVGDLAFIRDAEVLPPLREFVRLCEGEHGVIR